MVDPELRATWGPKIEVVRLKQGRSLTTAILHVSGTEPPPPEALCAAAAGWRSDPAGQIVRRPDENGKQVWWVNIVAGC